MATHFVPLSEEADVVDPNRIRALGCREKQGDRSDVGKLRRPAQNLVSAVRTFALSAH